MKLIRNMITISVAVLSVAAVAYVVIRHFDEVMRPFHMLLRKFGHASEPHVCDCECCEDEIFEIDSEE